MFFFSSKLWSYAMQVKQTMLDFRLQSVKGGKTSVDQFP